MSDSNERQWPDLSPEAAEVFTEYIHTLRQLGVIAGNALERQSAKELLKVWIKKLMKKGLLTPVDILHAIADAIDEDIHEAFKEGEKENED
jgi:hypothetical protein